MAKKSAPQHPQDKRPAVWALLSITAFLVVFFSTTVLGFGLILPFILAAGAMLLTLLIETVTRGKSWLFEEHYADAFAHEHMAARMFIFACGILLILETALLIGFVTDPRFDNVMLKLIRAKHCTLTHERC